jgi:hypothetical protein
MDRQGQTDITESDHGDFLAPGNQIVEIYHHSELLMS